MFTKAEVKKRYQTFRENYSSYLKALLSENQLSAFTFSLEEIDQIGNWFRNSAHPAPEFRIYQFIAYCGEAWMFHFGGEWYYAMNSDDVSYGYAQVINWGPPDYFWSAVTPVGWARLMQKGYAEPISLPWRRSLRFFRRRPEWNYQPKIEHNE